MIDMFAPNSKMMKTNFSIESGDAMEGEPILCWSPALGCEIWLDTDRVSDGYNIEKTKEKPPAYTDSNSLSQEWAIFRAKNGNDKQVFWTAAEQLEAGEADEFAFIDADGLDIDPSSIKFYYDVINYTDADGNEFEIGSITDLNEGRVALYSAAESTDSIGEDADGDNEYASVPQEKFETIRQLFVRAGFKVKVNRIKH
jgi:hypothetical protein